MSLTPAILRPLLIDCASRNFRDAGHFAYHFARGKLGGDPMYYALLERGLFPDRARILDLGCGQGLLAAWLLAACRQFETGEWPVGWPDPGRPADIRGVDILASDIRRAAAASQAPARFEQGDMRHVDFAQADVVVIMDALHYVDSAAQNDVLRRVCVALPPGGLFLTRVSDAAAGFGFRLGNWVDRTVAYFRGNRRPTLHCRSLRDWVHSLESLGFEVETAPMNGNLSFANVMLIARLRGRPARLESSAVLSTHHNA